MTGKRSKYDPIDDALRTLEQPAPDPDPVPVESAPAASTGPVPVGALPPALRGLATRARPPRAPTRGRSKVQLNVTVNPDVAAELRAAADRIPRAFSLGDLVAECIRLALAEAVGVLRSRGDEEQDSGGPGGGG